MAKKKSSFSEVQSMQEMSIGELQSKFYALAQNAERLKQDSDGANAPGQQAQPSATQGPASFASLDLGGNGGPNATDFTNLSDEDLAQKYLDPATLEARPDYADGSNPDRAIPKAVDGATWERLKLSFGNRNNAQTVKYLEQEYGEGNVKQSKSGAVVVKNKKDNSWYQLDPDGGGSGNFFEKALERTRDVLADNADIAVAVGVGIPAAIVAAPLVAGATAAGGLASVGAAGAVGAYSAAASKMTTTVLGRLAGTYEATPQDMARDIGIDMLFGFAGGAIVPGAKLTMDKFAEQVAKSGPALKKMGEPIKEALSEVFGFASGKNANSYRYIMDHADEVASITKTYKKGLSLDTKLMDTHNIRDTKDFAMRAKDALYAWYDDGINGVAKEAGDLFQPKINQTIKENFQGLVNSGYGKFSKTGSFVLNSLDDIAKLNPNEVTHLESEAGRGLMQKYINEMNKWLTKGELTGEAGVKQFVSFKSGLNRIYEEVAQEASDKGLNQTLKAIGDMNRGIKQKIFDSALQSDKYIGNAAAQEKIIKATSMFAATEKGYGTKKEAMYDMLKAVDKYNRLKDPGAFDSFYKDSFVTAKLTPKTGRAQDALELAIEDLNKFDPKLKELKHAVGLRRAAADTNPWMRSGIIGQAAALGSITTLNPSYVAGMLVTSPKVNAEASKLTGALFRGLSFVKRGLNDAQRTALTKDPAAMTSFLKTLVATPGIEAQMSTQLGDQLLGSGGQSGQQ